MLRSASRIRKLLLTSAALACVLLGLIGAVLPLLPTTPFLILATILSFNASPKLRRWLLRHPLFGPTIRNYLRHRAISRTALRNALLTLWLCIGLSCYLVASSPPLIALLLGIAIGVSIYMLRLKRIA